MDEAAGFDAHVQRLSPPLYFLRGMEDRFDYFDFIHTLLPTNLSLEDFFAELTRLYRNAIPPLKQLALLRRYALRDIPPLLATSRRAFARLRKAHQDYENLQD